MKAGHRIETCLPLVSSFLSLLAPEMKAGHRIETDVRGGHRRSSKVAPEMKAGHRIETDRSDLQSGLDDGARDEGGSPH